MIFISKYKRFFVYFHGAQTLYTKWTYHDMGEQPLHDSSTCVKVLNSGGLKFSQFKNIPVPLFAKKIQNLWAGQSPLKPPSPHYIGADYDLLALHTVCFLLFDRGTNSRAEDKGVPRKGTWHSRSQRIGK